MAFMGMMIAGAFAVVVIILLIIDLFFALLFLVLGIIFTVKKKKSGKVMLIISAVLFLTPLIIFLIFKLIFIPDHTTADTPDGQVIISFEVIGELKSCMEEPDAEKLDGLLTNYPELIYWRGNYGYSHGILMLATFNADKECASVILEHGGAYDDPAINENFRYNYSIGTYCGEIYDDNTVYGKEFPRDMETVYEMIEFMLENGASVKRPDPENGSILFSIDDLILHDKRIDDIDLKLIELLHSYGASYDALTAEYLGSGDGEITTVYHTLDEHYKKWTDYYNVVKDDNYNKLFELINE